jgi:hypothetical protein
MKYYIILIIKINEKMKIQITFAALLLISSSQQKRFVRPPTLHWNEDPTSVPNPLSGRLSITSS